MPSKINKKLNLKELHFAALAVDVVCFRVKDGNMEVLLGKVVSDNSFKGRWAHIGGLIQTKETADQAVDRLLDDKAGIKKIYKEQLYTFSAINRDPRGRVVSVAHLALANGDIQDIKKAQVQTEWRTISRARDLAYDHDEITQVAIERLRSKITYTDLARYLMPDEFTFSELQKVYEIVLGEGMDKRNFRKKIMSLGLLQDTKRTLRKGIMRPAALYRFKSHKG